MVKKIKRFIVFCLFSLVFSIVSGKIHKQSQKQNNESSFANDNENNGWMSAEAKCCPSGTVSLDRLGHCLNGVGGILDEGCYN